MNACRLLLSLMRGGTLTLSLALGCKREEAEHAAEIFEEHWPLIKVTPQIFKGCWALVLSPKSPSQEARYDA